MIEIDAELLGRITEEEFWFVEIQLGGNINYIDSKRLELSHAVCH